EERQENDEGASHAGQNSLGQPHVLFPTGDGNNRTRHTLGTIGTESSTASRRPCRRPDTQTATDEDEREKHEGKQESRRQKTEDLACGHDTVRPRPVGPFEDDSPFRGGRALRGPTTRHLG